MTTIDRRRMLASIIGTAAFASTGSASGTPAPELFQELHCQEDECRGSWFIAKQDSDCSSRYDFWTKPFCHIRHSDFLPSAIGRGVLWYNYGEYPYSLREPDALEYVDAVFKQDRQDWLNNPRQFAEHVADMSGVPTPLMPLLGERRSVGDGLRTAFIALDSQSLSSMDPDWADVLPAFRQCYDRLIGHLHVQERGYRHWQEWLRRTFPGYSLEDFYGKRASQCDTVILTSPALIETDYGLCPRASTEALVGEVVRRFGHALLDPQIADRLHGVADARPISRPRYFALGTATVNTPDPSRQLPLILDRQRQLVSGSFGPLATDRLSLFVATSADVHCDLEKPVLGPFYRVHAPRYQASSRKQGAIDLIALWPFEPA